MKFLHALIIALLIFTTSMPIGWAGQKPVATPDSISANTLTTLSEAERTAIARVNVETIKNITTTLAAKEMEGRGTAATGGERAAKFIADRFNKIGLQPLGSDGSYLQPIKFKTSQFLPTCAIKSGETNLIFGKDFLPAMPPDASEMNITGELVYIGYGAVAPALKHDDLANLDLKDKIVAIILGRPNNISVEDWQREANPSQLFFSLRKRGVIGFIIINYSAKTEDFEARLKQMAKRRPVLARSASNDESVGKLPPIVSVSNPGAEKLFQDTGVNLAQLLDKAANGEHVSRSLGKSVTITVRKQEQEEVGSNVIAVLPGSDNKVKDQAITYTAHYDAFGIDSNGTIYPGAADNALGVGMMLSLAEAYARLKPRHSIIFMAVTGEEYDLLGSYYWLEHPTWPLDKILADINYDGIGTEVYGAVKYTIGYGSEYSTLGNVLNDVNAALDLEVMADPFPDQQSFYRSDQYAFVQKGIPAIMLTGVPGGNQLITLARVGNYLNNHYHRPGDIVQADWHWDGAGTMAAVGLLMGMRIDGSDKLPEWLPNSPFKRAVTSGK